MEHSTEEAFTYEGNDLGANYTKAATTFKVWAPTADAVNVLLFSSGQVKKVDKGTHKMTGGTSAEKGVWTVTVNKDLKNVYYLLNDTPFLVEHSTVMDIVHLYMFNSASLSASSTFSFKSV